MSNIKVYSDKPRPSAVKTEHELLDALFDLFLRIDTHAAAKPHNNMLEKYDYFIKESPHHRACGSALQAKQLFFFSDFKDVKDQIEKVVKLIRLHTEDDEFAK